MIRSTARALCSSAAVRPLRPSPVAAIPARRRLLSATAPSALASASPAAAADQHLIPLYAKPQDLTLVRGQGALLFDTNDRRFIDFTAGIAVCSLGHADPQVAEVLYDQAKTLVHVSNLYRHPWAEHLATQLIASTSRSYLPDAQEDNPQGLSHVFFCNSGTEANEAALKFARAHNPDPAHYKILTFHNGFHGRSMGALSATPNRKYQAPFEPLVPGFASVPFNDLAAARAALSAGGYCGILVEPVQGEGGIYPATEEFLLGLRALADKHKCVLMYDEIQCGLSRTGRKWGHHWFPAAVAPDVVTCAKPLGNGVPIGAVLTTANVSKSLHPGAHGTTFGGNPLACRVAAHILDRLTAPELLAHVADMGDLVNQRLTGIQKRLGTGVVTNVRGMGLIAGLELASGDMAKKVVEGCREKGLLICTAGKLGNVMRIVPPLVIERDVLDEGLAVLEEAVGEAAK